MKDYFDGTSIYSLNARNVEAQSLLKKSKLKKSFVLLVVCPCANPTFRTTHRLGHVLASTQTEWPEEWEKEASYGKSSSEQSWIELVPKPPPPERLFTFQDDSLGQSEVILPTSRSLSAQSPQANTFVPSSIQQRHVSSPSSSPSPSCEAPQTPPLFHHLNSEEIIPFDPSNPHPYDVELIAQARTLCLPLPVADCAKRIILKFESERGQQKFNKPVVSMFIRAALFLACRQLGHGKTFAEFEFDLDKSSKSQFHRQFKTIDIFNKQYPTPATLTTEDPTTSFSSFSVPDFIQSEAAILRVDNRVRDRALAIAQHRVVQDLFSGKRPSATAAVVLSFAAECEEYFWGVTPYAEAAKLSVRTISNGQKALLKVVEEMVANGSLPDAFCSRWISYQPPTDGNYC